MSLNSKYKNEQQVLIIPSPAYAVVLPRACRALFVMIQDNSY